MIKLDIQLFTEPAKDPTVEELLLQMEALKKTMVPKEDLDKALENNKKLVTQITTERPAPKATVEVTPQDIVKRIEGRVEKLPHAKSSHETMVILTENYRDMQKLGMDVSNVDENVVAAIEKIIADSNGDPILFKSHMENKVKVK